MGALWGAPSQHCIARVDPKHFFTFQSFHSFDPFARQAASDMIGGVNGHVHGRENCSKPLQNVQTQLSTHDNPVC